MSSLPDPGVRLARLPQVRRWITVPVTLVVATLVLGFSVKLIPGLASAEFNVDLLFEQYHGTAGDVIALAIDTALSPTGIIVILLVLFALLLSVRRSPVSAFAVCSAIAVGWLSSALFKQIVDQSRPDAHLLQHPLVAAESSGSFPSGHTTFAVALAIGVYFLARGSRWVILAVVGGVAFSLLVAFSRLYLGVHYPSDVAGSFLVAAAAITVYSGLWNRYGLRMLRRIPVLQRIGQIPPAELPRGRQLAEGPTPEEH